MPLFTQPEVMKKKLDFNSQEKVFKTPEDDYLKKESSFNCLMESIDHLQKCQSKSMNTSF